MCTLWICGEWQSVKKAGTLMMILSVSDIIWEGRTTRCLPVPHTPAVWHWEGSRQDSARTQSYRQTTPRTGNHLEGEKTWSKRVLVEADMIPDKNNQSVITGHERGILKCKKMHWKCDAQIASGSGQKWHIWPQRYQTCSCNWISNPRVTTVWMQMNVDGTLNQEEHGKQTSSQ